MLKKHGLEIVLFIIIASICLSYIIAAFYAMPYDDDFSNGSLMKNYLEQSGYFISAIKSTAHIYMTWQGSYFGCFLTYFLSPFIRGGILGCEIEYAIGIVFFISSICVLLYQLLKYMFATVSKRLYISLLTVIVLYGPMYAYVNEVFFWHTGLCMYLIPFSCAIFAFAAVISYFRKKSNLKLCIAGLLAFVAAGGTLQISAFVCVMLLGLVIFHFLVTKKMGKVVVVFDGGLLGALIKVLAPGNYARKSVDVGDYSLFEIIVSAFKSVAMVLYKDYSRNLLIIVILVLLCIGILIFKNYDYGFKYPGMITIYALFAVIVVDFPVKFGYAREYFPLRCEFVERMSIVMCVFGVTLYWAGWIAKKVTFDFRKENMICIGLCVFILALPLLKYDALNETQPVSIYRKWLNGSLREFREEGEKLFFTIENAEEENVFIEKALDNLGIFCAINIREDKNCWVNIAVANYYGKETVQIAKGENDGE